MDAGSVDALWTSSLCFLPEMREEKAVGQEALENKASGAQLQKQWATQSLSEAPSLWLCGQGPSEQPPGLNFLPSAAVAREP